MAIAQYTFTQEQYIGQHNLTTVVGRFSGIRSQNGQTNWEECGPCPRLCELYPGICLITEVKAGKNLIQGSRRVPVGTMKTEYTDEEVHNNKNT